MNKKLVAIVYDFDGTLSRGNIQENSFIPEVAKMEKEQFWHNVHKKASKAKSDEILTYMYSMLEVAEKQHGALTKELLVAHASVKLFDGLDDNSWFKRHKSFASKLGIKIEHYIISSGICEMIQACPIAKEFKHIFASTFIYDEYGKAVWPGNAINYTTKTQYLFRINKGILNTHDNTRINEWIKPQERRIPFERIIFIGDGDTDIPSMKMTKHMGGHPIAVYDQKKLLEESGANTKIHKLISQNRVDFVAPADYTNNSPLDIIVRGLLERIAN